MNTPVFQLHGSSDSLDYDVLVFVDELPASVRDCADLCARYGQELESFFLSEGLPPKKLNINLATLHDGNVSAVFKGAPDEVNNACLRTYDLTRQFHPLQIRTPVARNLPLKTARALRSVCSMLSRSKYRPEIKGALKGNIREQIAVLGTLPFQADFENNSKTLSDPDLYKTIAFQIGQSLGLFEGAELYTKSEIGALYGELKPFLSRNHQPGDLPPLELIKQKWLSACATLENEIGHLRERDLYPQD